MYSFRRKNQESKRTIKSDSSSRRFVASASFILNLFTLNYDNYLVVVGYYYKRFEVVKLKNTRSKTVTTYMKSMFARHCIPFKLRSDNGPQYTSREFKDFSRSSKNIKSL